ncbi:uncharacterized protein LOC106180336 isoform X2 [Lingula anatina]|uniref:Uncharacterized protein LOC106180336 isoform X2 n=1 Tax=Lingula anatina TaxID=7574 RepID=A0A1S3KAU8_LINAN|nr:uncharacterized protein LOC106180336 isoform X2 [Lingula anatina]|eukprot:XP_013419750.1 uncharacterized protein LOC106180336 isoform X2 [Lingula anatina]
MATDWANFNTNPMKSGMIVVHPISESSAISSSDTQDPQDVTADDSTAVNDEDDEDAFISVDSPVDASEMLFLYNPTPGGLSGVESDASSLPPQQTKKKKTTPQSGTRKSERSRRQKRSYSPAPGGSNSKGTGKRKKKSGGRKQDTPRKVIQVRAYDKAPDGKPFSCDICKSPYVCNPMNSKNRGGLPSKHQPMPRHKIDPATGNTLTLCNACGLAFERPRRPRPSKEKLQVPQETKEKYLDEAKTFALSLVEGLNDPDAEKLFCPSFKNKPCGCMQRYIMGTGDNMEESRKRASILLQVLKDAKRLSQEKCYDPVEITMTSTGKLKRSSKVGLGNGHKRSKNFEEFVLSNRRFLKEELKFCERATQRVLIYSNNFLHKRLKTDETGNRLEKNNLKTNTQLPLINISDLPKERCCMFSCVSIALTHPKLLEQWRERAQSGQMEARRVIAEMLTPSGGYRTNCYKFIQLVTGCSNGTMNKVNEQMKQTGGDRDPPEHGLKKYWKNHPKKKKQVAKINESGPAQQPERPLQVVNLFASGSGSNENPAQSILHQFGGENSLVTVLSQEDEQIQLESQRQQLLQLKKQIHQQQLQLQQQQNVLNQQLLQQQVIQQPTEGNPQNISAQTILLNLGQGSSEPVTTNSAQTLLTDQREGRQSRVSASASYAAPVSPNTISQQAQQLQSSQLMQGQTHSQIGGSIASNQTVVTLPDYLSAVGANVSISSFLQGSSLPSETESQSSQEPQEHLIETQNIGGVNYTTLYIQPSQSGIIQQLLTQGVEASTSGESANEEEEGALLQQQSGENITIHHDENGEDTVEPQTVQLSSDIVQLLAQQGIHVGTLPKT